MLKKQKQQKNREEDDGLGKNTVEEHKRDGKDNSLITSLEEAPKNHPGNINGNMKILME